MKKTVLFILDDYHIGGVSSFVQQYSSILVEQKHKVIILGRRGNLVNKEKFFKGCKAIEIPSYVRSNGFIGRIMDFFEFQKYLSSIYFYFDVDIIHFSLTWSTLYSLMNITSWRKKKIITFYGAYNLEESSRDGLVDKISLIKYSILKYLHFFVLNYSDIIVTFSEYAKKIVVENFSKKLTDKIIIIGGFIDDAEIRLIKNTSSQKKTLTLVNFGRAEPRKGLDILLRTSKILIEKGYKIKVLIASPVSYYKWFNYLNLYEELDLFKSVQFIHKVSEKRKLEMLTQADLFIMPSTALETFGMTIIESLARGVPVIGNNTGSIPNILNKIDQSLLFSGSSKDLAEKIMYYSSLSTMEKNRLKLKCIYTVRKYYSRSVLKNKIIELYK